APVDAPEGRSPPVAADATRLRAALAAGDFEGTLRELDATPNLDPVDAASLRAAALDGLGRSSEARTVLDEALAHRAAGLLLVQRAELLRKIGDERGARADFERASADPQASHEVLHAVFHELESRRDARARAVIERAIALQPTAEYLMDLAFFHQDRSEPAACLEAARRASALAPTALDPRALIGHSLIALERYPEAEALFVELSRESPDQAHGLIGRARIRARRGELQEAAALYAEAARLEPLGSVSASRYGDVLFELGRDAEALALYTQSLAAAPNAETAFRRGITYKALGDSRAARADFERALRLEPTHVGALARLLRQVGPSEARDLPQLAAALRAAESPFAQLVALGDALRDYDEYALAQGLYEHALALDPDDVEARTSLGLCLANQLQRRAAEEVFDAALERDPRSVRALYLRGANKRYDERYAEALGDLDAALALDPEHAAARVMRADALRHLRRLEEAGVDYALVLQAEPRNLDALVGYADALAAAGDLPRALDLARRAAELHPRSHVAQQTRAEFASAQGLDAEALEAYRGALALAPEDLASQRQIVGLLLKLDRWEEAAAAADAVLARDPQDPSVRFARATSRRHAERYADAIADYRALLAVAPGDAQLHFGLGDTYLGLEDYPAAEASFREAVRLDATYAPGVYGLGIALARQRAWASALEAFERVLELGFGGEPDFAAELCLARFHADDPARAQAELTRLLADAPTSPALLWAQAELHAAQGEPVAQVHADLERARAGAPSRRLHRLLDALQARLEAR
ncbi:MAG: tetratricopeptide repeat protein, partial [Planctomycetes bacterium]|nr:tetratricopeptide repeat protein [Planctomycetota bacterium]